MLPSLHVHPYRLVRCISIFNIPSLKCTNKIATWAIDGEKERKKNKSSYQNICACNLCSISQMHGKERKTKHNENHFDMQDPRKKFVAHNFTNVCYEESKSNSASAHFLWHRFLVFLSKIANEMMVTHCTKIFRTFRWTTTTTTTQIVGCQYMYRLVSM